MLISSAESRILNQISWVLEKPAGLLQYCMSFVCYVYSCFVNGCRKFCGPNFNSVCPSGVEVSEQLKQIKCLRMLVVRYEFILIQSRESTVPLI